MFTQTHKLDLIIFDWDGTLMDSTAHIVHALQAAARALNIEPPASADCQHIIGLGLIDAMTYLFPDVAPKLYPSLATQFQKHYMMDQPDLPLFPDIISSLERIQARGIPMAVATGKERVGLNAALEKTNTAHFFQATRTVDECQPKPHPEMILSLCQELNLDPKRTLMVGDTTHDLGMAHQASALGLGVLTGAHALDLLQTSQALHIAANLDAGLHWLEQHGYLG